MANDKSPTQPAHPDLEGLAFDLFRQRVGVTGRATEYEALQAYRHAETFLAVREQVRAGALTPAGPEGLQLDSACSPNLPPTHPYNLVAKVHTDRKTGVQTPGDLGRVAKIKAWLDKNPTPENNPDELVSRLNRQFHGLGWDLPTINTARAILPAYCEN